jgi:hypothetical protein
MLTPEILAAQKAGSLVEATFYSDAKAATVLKTAIAGLVTEFELLQNKAAAGAISIAPTISTMAGNIVKDGTGRVVNPDHPLISPEDTRSMSHLNPVAGMTLEQKSQQNLLKIHLACLFQLIIIQSKKLLDLFFLSLTHWLSEILIQL